MPARRGGGRHAGSGYRPAGGCLPGDGCLPEGICPGCVCVSRGYLLAMGCLPRGVSACKVDINIFEQPIHSLENNTVQ